jgi:hypothetical protein
VSQEISNDLFLKVLANANEQATYECRENYLRSCEAHGGQFLQIVPMVRQIHAEVRDYQI